MNFAAGGWASLHMAKGIPGRLSPPHTPPLICKARAFERHCDAG
jgi:hypothetical protein